MDILSELVNPKYPKCLTRCYLSQGCFYCDDCGLKVRGRSKSGIEAREHPLPAPAPTP